MGGKPFKQPWQSELGIDWFLMAGLAAIATGCHIFFDLTAAYEPRALATPWGIGFPLAVGTMFLRPLQRVWEFVMKTLGVVVFIAFWAGVIAFIYFLFFANPTPIATPTSNPDPAKQSPPARTTPGKPHAKR